MPTFGVGINPAGAVAGGRVASRAIRGVGANAVATSVQIRVMQTRMSGLTTSSWLAHRALLKTASALTSIITIVKASRAIAEYDTALAKIEAIAGSLNQTLGKLPDLIREIGVSSQYGATEAAEAALVLVRATGSVDAATRTLTDTVNLATAADMSLADSANVVMGTLRQFNLGLEESTRVVDVLTNTANQTNTDIAGLAEGLKYAGQIASTAGLEIEEVVAALGVLADNNIKGSLAGTALRGMLVSLLDPTSKAERTLERMGLTIEEINPEMVDMVTIFQEFGKQGLSATEAVRIFTRRASTGTTVLSSFNEKLTELAESNTHATDVTARNAERIEKSLIPAFKKVRNAAEEMFQSWGDRGAKQFLSDFAETLREAILVMAESEHVTEEFSARSERLARQIEGLSVAVSTFVVGITAAKAGMLLFNKVLKGNPFVRILFLLSALAGALTFFRKEMIILGDKTFTVGDLIVASFEHVRDSLQFIFRSLGNMWQYFTKAFANTWYGMLAISILGDMIGFLDLMRKNWQIVLRDILNDIKGWANGVLGYFHGIYKSLQELLTTGHLPLENIKKYMIEGMTTDYIGDLDKIFSATPFKYAMEQITDNPDFFAQLDEFFNPESAIKSILERANARREAREAAQALLEQERQNDAGLLGPMFEGQTPAGPPEREFATQGELRARSNFADYLQKLDQEKTLLSLSNKEREVRMARFEAEAILLESGYGEAQVNNLLNFVEAETRVVEEMRQIKELTDSIAGAFSDALTDMAFDFENAEDHAKNFFKTVAKLAFQQYAAAPLAGLLGQSLFGFLAPGGAGTPKPSARGNVVPFADGGVVTRKTIAPMAMFGEAGPEAIMPLKRGADGKLGVAASGNSSPTVVIHVHGVKDTAGFQRSNQQIARAAARALQNNMRSR